MYALSLQFISVWVSLSLLLLDERKPQRFVVKGVIREEVYPGDRSFTVRDRLKATFCMIRC